MQLGIPNDEVYYKMLKWFNRNYPLEMHRFIASISPNQIECKKWLVDGLDDIQIPRNDKGKFNIEIVGGWFGFPLIDLLWDKYGDQIHEIHFFDVDPFAAKVFSVYLSMWDVNIKLNSSSLVHIKISTGDSGDYCKYTKKRRAHLVINTSCEHMPNMKEQREYYYESNNMVLALQSNNKTNEPDHINCVESCQELAEQAGCIIVDKDDKIMKSAGSEHWNRFMIYGKWK